MNENTATDTYESDTEQSESEERSPISDVSCPACGSERFELKAVDEWANADLSIYCYCAECGNATGKMWDRTVDNRITDTDRSESD